MARKSVNASAAARRMIMMGAHPQPHNVERLLVRAKAMASIVRTTCEMIKAKEARVAAITCVNSFCSTRNLSTLNYRRVRNGSSVNGQGQCRQGRPYQAPRKLIKC
eukprot:11183812-Karenia_brevis.AAC.1